MPSIGKKEEIWYTTQNRILIPQCTQVEGVQITTKTNECYVDLPVTFIIKQTKMVGFLNDENIIVSQSKKSNCNPGQCLIEISMRHLKRLSRDSQETLKRFSRDIS